MVSALRFTEQVSHVMYVPGIGGFGESVAYERC